MAEEVPEDVTEDPLLVVLLGPTASAKTSLSLVLAERFGAEIVNCDSVAMYREFEIGTAKPSAAERARVPHHLLDFVEPSSYITAGEYSSRARRVLDEIKDREAMPIVVGGSGLYLRALLEGLFEGPPRSDELREKLKQRAESKGGSYLHRVLSRLDPSSAEKIHHNDIPKLIRAIEVCITSREKMSKLWQRGRDPLHGFRIVRIGLNPPREQLYERINQRARQMFDLGIVEETRQLFNKYGDAASALNALGYRHALQFIRGQIDYATAIQATQQAHRNYAKRQMTWFRRELNVYWLEGFGNNQGLQRMAIARVEEKIAVH